MYLEADSLIKISTMIYLVFLVYLFIKKSYTIQQHLLFFCSFALSVGLINLMLFPIIIDDFNSIPYIQARQYKHNLLPFEYWIRDLFENRTINDVNNNYYHGEMTLEEIHAHLQIYRAELIQLILFSFLNLAIITALVSCRLWLTHKRLTVRRAIMLPIFLIIFIDLIYFFVYYNFSLNTDGFDTAFIIFQIFGIFLGCLFFRLSRHWVNIIQGESNK